MLHTEKIRSTKREQTAQRGEMPTMRSLQKTLHTWAVHVSFIVDISKNGSKFQKASKTTPFFRVFFLPYSSLFRICLEQKLYDSNQQKMRAGAECKQCARLKYNPVRGVCK